MENIDIIRDFDVLNSDEKLRIRINALAPEDGWFVVEVTIALGDSSKQIRIPHFEQFDLFWRCYQFISVTVRKMIDEGLEIDLEGATLQELFPFTAENWPQIGSDEMPESKSP